MQTESVAQRLADEVRGAMARRRITQADLAVALHMSQPAVSRRLNGTVDFTVSELNVVAGMLEVEPAELLRSAS